MNQEIEQLLNQANEARYEHPLEACKLARKALVIAEREQDKAATAECLRTLGAGNVILSDFKEAIEFLHKAYGIYTELKAVEGKIHTASNIAAAYQKMGNYALALQWNQEALRQRKSTKANPVTANTLVNMATVYYKLGQYRPAEEYAQQSLEAFEELQNLHGLAISHTTLGNVYEKRGRQQEALKEFQKAEKNARKADNPATLAPVLQSVGLLYQRMGKDGKALLNYWEALGIQEDIGDKQAMGNLYVDMCHIHNESGAYGEALEYGERALAIAKEIGNKENEYHAHKALSHLYETINEHHNALFHYKLYHRLQREVIGIQTSMQLSVGIGGENAGVGDVNQQLEQTNFQKLQAVQMFYEKTMETETLQDQIDRMETAIKKSLRMQEGCFAGEDELVKYWPDSFLFYQGAGLVPQTAIWLHEIEDRKLLALLEYPNDEAATYTLVAMLTHMTRHILDASPLYSAGEILHKLNDEVMNNIIWQQQLAANPLSAAFVIIDQGMGELQYCGTNIPLHMFSGGKHIMLAGDNKPIGDGAEAFKTRSIPLEDVDRIYIWNDAFGRIGTGKKAITHQLLLHLITSLSGRTMQKQRNALEEQLEELLSQHTVSQDLCLLGIRLDD